MKTRILYLAMLMFLSLNLFSQNFNLNEYEIYIGDTLISKSDFIKYNGSLKTSQTKKLKFKPITNGYKKTYYINGKLCSTGEIKKLKRNGLWNFWHSNGKKAREGKFIEGKQEGVHKYWYNNGILRAIGNWKNGVYEGEWEMYNVDGREKKVEIYKNGKKTK